MAIKINLLPREAAPARGRAATSIRMPKVSLGGGLLSKLATLLFLVVVVGLGAAGYMAWAEKKQVTQEIITLRAQNDRLNAQLKELRITEEARLDIKRRLEVIGRVAKSQGMAVSMMTTVLKSLPQGVWLTSLDVKPREVKVKVEPGRGTGGSEITRTLDLLEQRRREMRAETPGTPAPAPREAKEVLQLDGFSLVLKGQAFNNFQLADFMDALKRSGLFADVDFVVTQAERIDRTQVVAFEVTASVKL